MSRQTAEKSFHIFCEHFSANLWEVWIHLPVGEDLQLVESRYSQLGFPGAVGSTDCTHVSGERCPHSEKTTHSGKEGYSTSVYEATVDFSGRILASTKGYPGAQSDKTVVKRDISVLRVREDSPWNALKFCLHKKNGDTVEHTGGSLIIDGGYHQWSFLMCPMKITSTIEEQRWSKRLESPRKDVECLFGRLKGRFRIFKTGILMGDPNKVDNAWFTCCILHNMLRQFDGLGELEVDMDWTGKDGRTENNTAPPEEGPEICAAGEVADAEPGFDAFRARPSRTLHICIWQGGARLAEAAGMNPSC